ncbi:MAG TPA: ABC transporter permease [Actinomycetota bacterium]|nr:ABC transporter permease [Actinomycetota bacterium]
MSEGTVPPPEEDPKGSTTKRAATGEEPEAEPRAAHEIEAGAMLTGAIVTTGRAGWRQALLVPLLAVFTALVVGGLVIVFSDEQALEKWASFFRNPIAALAASWTAVREAYYALFTGALGSPSEIARSLASGDIERIQGALFPLSETIVTATPLIFVGLSVAVGFRAGLFNIGAEGQMNVGAIVGSLAGFTLTSLPGPIHLAVMILASLAGGMAWGAIPGFLKAKTGAHEVITTIMLNFIAVSLALYLLSTDLFTQRAEPIARPVQVAYPHLFGSSLRVHFGIFVALGVAALVAWLLNRTTIGFEFRAVGANPDAARAAGMNPTRTTIAVMAIAGGLAGLAGGNQLASVTPSLIPGFASGLGFDGIAGALLGRARPAGVVAAAFLFGMLRAGGRTMQATVQVPIDIIVVIQALVIAFVAAPALVRAIYRIRAARVAGPEAFAKGWGG